MHHPSTMSYCPSSERRSEPFVHSAGGVTNGTRNFQHLERPIQFALSHEFGAGAPCKRCSDCPGLDLHYWRKTCKACRCHIKEHDVPEPDHSNCDAVLCKLFGGHAHGHFLASSTVGFGTALQSSMLHHASREWPASDATSSSARSEASSEDTQSTQVDSPSRHRDSVTSTEHARSMDHCWRTPSITEAHGTSHTSVPHSAVTTAEVQSRQQEGKSTQTDLNFNSEERRNMEAFIADTRAKHFGIAESMKYDAEKQDSTNRERIHEIECTESRRKFATAANQSCRHCGTHFQGGDQAVYTKHGPPTELFHSKCFRCSDCEELLTDLLYFFKDGKYLCGRHYGDSIYPRCAGCDELIMTAEYTEADGASWHNGHFCCSNCDIPLGGMKYVRTDNRQLCFECHIKFFSHVCSTCHKAILPDETRLSHKGVFWHNKLNCFRCASCNEPLIERKFVFKNGRTFCSFDCKEKFN